jgi:hypothetical protein
MANVLTSVPYKIDTASGTSFKAQGGLPNNQPITVTGVYWLNPVTIGDTFVISGGLVLNGRCEVAAQSQFFQLIPGVLANDFTVSTLASGTLWIYTA